MLYIALAEAAIIALLIGLFLVRERDHDRTLFERDTSWTAERSELLTRIQHPHVLHVQPLHTQEASEDHSDVAEFERVGKILFDSEDQQG